MTDAFHRNYTIYPILLGDDSEVPFIDVKDSYEVGICDTFEVSYLSAVKYFSFHLLNNDLLTAIITIFCCSTRNLGGRTASNFYYTFNSSRFNESVLFIASDSMVP